MSFNCSASPRVIPADKQFYCDSRWVLVTFVFVLMVVSATVLLAVFYWGKRIKGYERLRVRRMVLAYIPWVALIIHAQVGPGYVMYGIPNVPCWVRSLLTMMVVPLIASNIVLRLMIFFFLTKLAREMPQLTKEEMPDDLGEKNMFQRVLRATFDVFYALYALLFPERVTMARARVIRALTFVASAKGTFVIFVAILLPFLIIALSLISTDPTYLACTGCALAVTEVVEIIAVGLFFLIFGALAAYRVRKYPDPWGLRREVTLMVWASVVVLVGFVLGAFANPPIDSTFDHQLIIGVGFIAYMGAQTIYQVVQAHRSESGNAELRRALQERRGKKAKPQIKSIADSNVNSTQQTTVPTDRLLIKQVLANPTLLGKFEEFLVSELGVESLMFLRDTSEWKKTYFDVAPSARLARAKKIYNTYVNPAGSFPVNIPSTLLTVIRSKVVQDEKADCPEDLFDAAREEISDLLQIGALQRFQASTDYLTFLSSSSIVPSSTQV